MDQHLVRIGGHDIELALEPGDVITDVIVLARVQSFEGGRKTALSIGESDTVDYITGLGMLEYAREIYGEDPS